jgi:hypothetical protein
MSKHFQTKTDRKGHPVEKTRFVGRIPMIWDNAGNARIGESRYGDFVPKTDITHIHEQMRS